MKTETQTVGYKPLALLTGVRSDSHTWNLAYLNLHLEEHGFDVCNLGATVSHEDILQQVKRLSPDLLVVSSVNGHGFIEGREIASALSANLSYLPKVIGGLLSTDPREEPSVKAVLQADGFDAVFVGPGSIDEFSTFLDSVARGVCKEAAS